MGKRIILTVFLGIAWNTSLFAQSDPWKCAPTSNTHLICFIPVSSGSLGAVNSPAPAFNSAFATQLSQLPLLSPASGVILSFDKSLQMSPRQTIFCRVSTERARTIGKHKLLLAFAYQRFRFNSIDGNDLNNLSFVFQSQTSQGKASSYASEREYVDFKFDQYVGLITFGVTRNTDVSVLLPFERVSVGATTTDDYVYSVDAAGRAQGSPVKLPDSHTGAPPPTAESATC